MMQTSAILFQKETGKYELYWTGFVVTFLVCLDANRTTFQFYVKLDSSICLINDSKRALQASIMQEDDGSHATHSLYSLRS